MNEAEHQDKAVVNQVLTEFLAREPDIFLGRKKDYLMNRIDEQLLLMGNKISPERIPEIKEKLESFLFGYYILDDALHDPDISDIRCLAPDRIRIKKKGKRMDYDKRFEDDADYQQFINLVAVKNHTNLADINAVQTFTDNHTLKNTRLRMTLTTPYVTSSGYASLHIRKTDRKYTIKELVQAGMFPKDIAEYIASDEFIKHGLLVVGHGGAGKTIFLNSMIEHIPQDMCGCFIQENDELFAVSHPEMMFEHIVTVKGEGKIGYSLKDLTRTALLQDLDYIGIGEVKGEEAADFMKAGYTGHIPWTTSHGQGAMDGVHKFADYIKQATGYDIEECEKMMTGIRHVVYLEHFKIKELVRIEGYDEDEKHLIYHTLYQYKESGGGAC